MKSMFIHQQPRPRTKHTEELLWSKPNIFIEPPLIAGAFLFYQGVGQMDIPACFGSMMSQVRILLPWRGLGIECEANFRKDAQISNYDRRGQARTLPLHIKAVYQILNLIVVVRIHEGLQKNMVCEAFLRDVPDCESGEQGSNPALTPKIKYCAPLAKLDKAAVFETEDWKFESFTGFKL